MKAQSRNFLVENIYILSAFAVRHNLVRFGQRLSLTTLLACAVSRGSTCGGPYEPLWRSKKSSFVVFTTGFRAAANVSRVMCVTMRARITR